jgi:hypothetical protein
LSDFRDDIHINPNGQKRMAETVVKYMDANQTSLK